MHGQLFAYVLMLADSAPDPNAVKVAALTLVGGVVATGGAVLVAFRSPRESRSERRLQREDDRYHAALKAQLADAERVARESQADSTAAQARVAVYERFFYRHHMDPVKIVRGDEDVDDLRF